MLPNKGGQLTWTPEEKRALLSTHVDLDEGSRSASILLVRQAGDVGGVAQVAPLGLALDNMVLRMHHGRYR